MSSYRFSWLRSDGWTRLGLAGAVAAMFASPMMWSLGIFGEGDPALKRALIFLFSSMWFAVGVGYMIGWALRGFLIRVKDHDDDDDDAPAAHRPAAGAAHAAATPPVHRPAGH